MAICTTCGAASAVGAAHCAACGAAFTAAGPGAAPGAGPGTGAAPAIGEVEFGAGGGEDDGGAPGRWGLGREVAPRRGSGALERLADWGTALRVAAAPTALLLLAGLPGAFALDRSAGGLGLGFGDRYGVGLAAALAAFGGPLTAHTTTDPPTTGTQSDLALVVLPMTVTLLWALLFGLGVRRWAGRTVRQAAPAAVLATLAVWLLALLAGFEQQRGLADVLEAVEGRAERVEVTAGLVRPVLGSGVLAALVVAWICLGAPAVRRRAPAWWAAAVAVGRGWGAAVGLSTLAALVSLATQLPVEGRLAGLLILPNVGLALLGFGAGAGIHFHAGVVFGGGEGSADWGDQTYSLLDLHGQSGLWRLAVLVALATVALLAWSVRRLDRPGRLRAAGLVWIGGTLLTAAAGGRYETGMSRLAVVEGGATGMTSVFELGQDLLPLLTAHLLLAGLGVLAVPELLDRLGGRGRPAAPEDPGPEEDDPTGLELTASSGYPAPPGGEVLDFGKR